MKTTWVVGVLAAAAVLGCGHATHQHLGAHASGAAQVDDDGGDDDGDEAGEQERAVALADVPRTVLDAADAAVPGARWTSASVELEGGAEVYELAGTDADGEVEVEVSASGQVLEIERADD